MPRRLKYTFRKPDTPGNPLANMVDVVSPKLQALCMCIVNMKPAYKIADIIRYFNHDELVESVRTLEVLINACEMLHDDDEYYNITDLINKIIPYVHALQNCKPRSLNVVYAYDNLVATIR